MARKGGFADFSFSLRGPSSLSHAGGSTCPSALKITALEQTPHFFVGSCSVLFFCDWISRGRMWACTDRHLVRLVADHITARTQEGRGRGRELQLRLQLRLRPRLPAQGSGSGGDGGVVRVRGRHGGRAASPGEAARGPPPTGKKKKTESPRTEQCQRNKCLRVEEEGTAPKGKG